MSRLRELVEAGDRLDPHRRRPRRSTAARSTTFGERIAEMAQLGRRHERDRQHGRARTRVERRRARSRSPRRASSRSCRSSAGTRTGSRARPTSSARRCTACDNVCCLTGDDVTAGDEPEARRVFDLDGPQLIRVATGARARAATCRAARSTPRRRSSSARSRTRAHRRSTTAPQRAAKKIAAGARFLQLQICYHPDRLEAFVGALARAGAHPTRRDPPRDRARPRRARLAFMDRDVPGIDVPAETIARIEQADDQAEAAYQLGARAGAPRALRCPACAACT